MAGARYHSRSASSAGTPCSTSGHALACARARSRGPDPACISDVTDEWRDRAATRTGSSRMVAHELTSPLAAIVELHRHRARGHPGRPARTDQGDHGPQQGPRRSAARSREGPAVPEQAGGGQDRAHHREASTCGRCSRSSWSSSAGRRNGKRSSCVLQADLPRPTATRRPGRPRPDLHEPDLQRDQVQPRGRPPHCIARKPRRRLRGRSSPTRASA